MIKIKIVITLILACLFASCSGGGSKITIYLKSNPSSADFGTILFGQFETMDFTITNDYAVAVTINQIRITGSGSQHFTITNGDAITNIPGNAGTEIITIKCEPTASGSIVATLEITFIDPEGNQKILKVSLKARGRAVPMFSTNVGGTPPTIDFGAVALGSSMNYNFTVTNTGNANLEITAVTILGSVDFSIISGWTGSKVIINPSLSHSLAVRFTATVSIPQNADLRISHNATNEVNPFEIKLSGSGSRAQFAINISSTPPLYDYGKIFVNGSRNHTFVITNAGLDDLVINNIQITGVGFSIISGWSYGNPLIIPFGGGTGNLVIAFQPTVLGYASATIELFHNASNVNSPYEFTLEGEAVDNYTATTFTLGLNPLPGGNIVNLTDDSYTSAIPIGFDFVFYGLIYSDLYICSNGYVGFGPTTSYNWFHSGPYPSTNYGANFIAVFACDLNPEFGGTIKYQLSGVDPNRKFVIEYLNVPDRYGNGNYSGQIHIYESTNLIELHYPTSGNDFSIAAGIGLENRDETKGINYTGGSTTNPITLPPSINIRYN